MPSDSGVCVLYTGTPSVFKPDTVSVSLVVSDSRSESGFGLFLESVMWEDVSLLGTGVLLLDLRPMWSLTYGVSLPGTWLVAVFVTYSLLSLLRALNVSLSKRDFGREGRMCSGVFSLLVVSP